MVTPCAGSPVGTWFYTQACVDDPLGDFRQLCAGVTTVSSNSTLSGRVDFTATTVRRQVSTTFATTVNLPASCASLGCSTIQSVLRQTAPNATCVSATNGGCDCSISGSSTLDEQGTYTDRNGTITVNVTSPTAMTRTFDTCITGGAMALRESSATSATSKGTTTVTRQP
jgi:hypothetical protein